MGKVRIKTLGIEEFEEQQKEQAKVKKEQKKARKTAKGAHGGERVVSMAPSEEELEKTTTADSLQTTEKTAVDSSRLTVDKKRAKPHLARQRSKRYKDAIFQIDRNRTYPLTEALELLRKVSANWRIDGTVELHINTIEKGNLGQASLPHGIGKKLRVAVATDKLLDDITKGKIDFDILVAAPAMMPKLAKLAKILGPRGLMPNPKSQTITDEPEKLVKKLEEGNQLQLKTESQAPIIHLIVGKLSMKDKELEENVVAIIQTIGKQKIKNVTLKSTMSPGIKLAV